MNIFLYAEQTTQDAVRHQPTTTSKKQKKLLLLSVGVVFSVF